MLIKNGLVFCEDFALREGDVYTEFDRISEPYSQSEVLDATGCIVAPGFIDIHIHGAYGTDFCDELPWYHHGDEKTRSTEYGQGRERVYGQPR